MDIISDKWFLAIIVLLLVLILFLFAFILIIGFYIFKKNKGPSLKPKLKEPSLHSIKPTEIKGHCFQHEDEKSVAVCSICEQEICDSCLRHVDHLNFCPEHYDDYTQNEWTAITNQMTTPDTPHAGIYIYNFKRDQWQKKKVPTYILTDYKLNMEGDFIESYVMLHVRKQDEVTLRKLLNFNKVEKL